MSVAVVIGRFALLRQRELDLVQRALATAERAVVVLGSAFHARTPRDPLTWEERADVIRHCVPEADRKRLRFVPVRDYFDDARWVAAVKRAVAEATPADETVRLRCFEGRRAQAYADWFAAWRPEAIAAGDDPDPAQLRCIFLQHESSASPASLEERRDAALAVLSRWMPRPAIEYLRAWSQLPHYRELVEDQHAVDEFIKPWRGSPYPPIFTTVDAVVTCAGHVLLVKRGARPGKGLRALPGGFLDQDERLADGALRELREETGLGLHETVLRHALRRVVTFDHPRRSLRGRIVTHAHHFALDLERLPEVKGGDDAADASWVPTAGLGALESQMYEDHFHILDEFLQLTGDARPA